MQLINNKKFIIIALNLSKEIFVIHIAYLKAKILINLAQETCITLLLTKKATVLEKYSDFVDIFFRKVSCRAI